MLDISPVEEVEVLEIEFGTRTRSDGSTSRCIVDSKRLTLETVIETKEGKSTPRQIMEQSRHDKELHLRCNVPASIDSRGSTSWNGIIHIDKDGYPTLYDNGTGVLYLVADRVGDMFGKHKVAVSDQPTPQALEAVSDQPTSKVLKAFRNDPGGGVPTSTSGNLSARQRLAAASLSNPANLAKVEKELAEEEFIDPYKMFLKEQISTASAPPNAGKTLSMMHITVEGVKAGLIKGEDVYHFNMDDGRGGAVQKARILNFHGINEMDLSPDDVRQVLIEDDVKGLIFIIDTYTKMSDPMDKKAQRADMQFFREITKAGGTIIILGHVNKHVDHSGKHIIAGTTEMKDNADCSYVLSVLRHDEQSGEYVIQYENVKARGSNVQKMTFGYTKTDKSTYPDIFNSVHAVDKDQSEKINMKLQAEESMKKDQPMIDSIRKAILEGGFRKLREIQNYCQHEYAFSHRKIKIVLERYTDSWTGHPNLWKKIIGKNNSYLFYLDGEEVPIPPPPSVKS